MGQVDKIHRQDQEQYLWQDTDNNHNQHNLDLEPEKISFGDKAIRDPLNIEMSSHLGWGQIPKPRNLKSTDQNDNDIESSSKAHVITFL